MEKQYGARGTGSNQYEVGSHDVTPPPSLKDMGIEKMESVRWQKAGEFLKGMEKTKGSLLRGNMLLPREKELPSLKDMAERKAGEFLKGMGKQRPGEYKRLQHVTVSPSLKDMGIEKMESVRWQKAAHISNEKV